MHTAKSADKKTINSSAVNFLATKLHKISFFPQAIKVTQDWEWKQTSQPDH